MKRPITLHRYCEKRGAQARLSEYLQVSAALISQWASGVKTVPEDRAPSIEWFTDFTVTVEKLCPGTRWLRVPHPEWPRGKPLVDYSPPLDGEPGPSPRAANQATAGA